MPKTGTLRRKALACLAGFGVLASLAVPSGVAFSATEVPSSESAMPDVISSETTEPVETSQHPESAEPTESEVDAETQPEAEASPLQDQPQAAAVAPQNLDGCSYAAPGSGGAYAQSLCWLDFSGVTTEYNRVWTVIPAYTYTSLLTGQQITSSTNIFNSGSPGNSKYWGNIQNHPVSIDIPGGYTLTARLDIEGTAGHARNRAVTAQGFPTYAGAFLGNRSFYQGVSGQPALNHAIAGTSATTRISLRNIQLRDDGGNLLNNYSVVVADAESTDTGERIDWATTGRNFTWLPNDPGAFEAASTESAAKVATMGNACPAGYSPRTKVETPTSASTAHCASNTSSTKTGTAMLQTGPTTTGAPFNVTQTMVGGGNQGVAFGVVFGRANLTVEVEDRAFTSVGANTERTTANFTGTLDYGSRTQQAQTGPTGMVGEMVPVTIPLVSGGTEVIFNSSAPAEVASSYTPTWTCEKTDPLRATPLTHTGLNPPSSSFRTVGAGQFVDCTVTYRPPYLTLVKEVDADGSEAATRPADWTLNAVATEGSTVAVAGDRAERLPLLTGTYSFSETAPTGENSWPYGYEWEDLSCVPHAGSTGLSSFTVDRTPDSHAVATAQLNLVQGNDVVCTFTNRAVEPRLDVAKTVDPESGTLVEAGDHLTYTLSFDNSTGTYPATVDHHDHLADVLDDARLDLTTLRYGDGTHNRTTPIDNGDDDDVMATPVDMDGTNPLLHLHGQVPRAEIRTVSFTVEVKSDVEDLTQREDPSDPRRGFQLINFLTEADAQPPATCEEPTDDAGDESTLCTENSIPAWTLTKGSRPADGAWLHDGGNVHYVLSAQKMNRNTELNGLVFTDDLTDVFTVADWAPEAIVPGGARARGVYFFDAHGNSLDAEGHPHPEGSAQPAYAGDTGVPEPMWDATERRWTITSPEIDVPAEVARAELWFAVEVGSSRQIPGQESPAAPQTGEQFTNYATATSASLEPVQCVTGSLAGGGHDADFPEACTTTHALQANYFTIRKDASGAGDDLPRDGDGLPVYSDDATGLWNMVGHEFQIHDDVDGARSEHQSQYLCRTEYNPYTGDGWDGQYITGGTSDWGAGSETLAAIIQWNSEHQEDPLEPCAVFYAQPEGSGGQTGRWRAENLPAGDYWLLETRAPDRQISNSGTQIREIPGVQLLAEPISFRVWPLEEGAEAEVPELGEGQPNPAQYGRSQLDITTPGADSVVPRCQPGSTVASRDVACVNPTGYLMLVKDTVPAKLPVTGGVWLRALTVGGGVLLVVAVAAILWRRRTA